MTLGLLNLALAVLNWLAVFYDIQQGRAGILTIFCGIAAVLCSLTFGLQLLNYLEEME